MRADLADQTKVADLLPALRVFARLHRADPNAADQLVRQTLTDAGGKLDDFQPQLRRKTWLLSIMHGLSRDQAAGGDGQQGMAHAVSSWNSEARQVWSALSRLPLHHREVLVLTDVLGERYEDAARICNCAVGTIKSRLNRARHHMRHELRSTTGA